MAPRIALGVLAAIVALSAGALLAFLLIARPLPPSLETGIAPQEVPVTTQAFDDARDVQAIAELAAPQGLLAPAAGRVTAESCDPGGVIESGGSLVAIDGEPLLNLATDVPLWRDLTSGASGADVASLQRELVRLGAAIDVDGRFGAATLAALRDLVAAIGGDTGIDGLMLSRILWLPATGVTSVVCSVSLGDAVAPGQELARLPRPLASVAVEQLPSGLMAGDRVLRIGSSVVPVNDAGVVTDAQALASLETAGVAWREDSEGPQVIPAVLALAEPLAVAVIPPSALYDAAGADACVTVDGAPTAVHVAGSQLGQTFVVFEHDPRPDTVDATPRGSAPCR